MGTRIDKLAPVPGEGVLKITLITNISTAVVEVEAAGADEVPDITFSGHPIEYTGAEKSTVVLMLSAEVHAMLGLPPDFNKVKFSNVDESKMKRGSALNANFEGGSNVSYFTPRGYKDKFDGLAEEGKGDHIVFFGLQYLIKEYLTGEVVTSEKIEEAEAFIARYMADVRVAGPSFEKGFDYTMFPRGDWVAMATGDYDGTGEADPAKAGVLPIKIEALPEGSLLSPGVCCFKLTNTHPRFYWLPNFLETILVQVWYPMTVATQTREFRKTIQAYSYLSERVSQVPEVAGLGPSEFTIKNITDDGLAVHIAQVHHLSSLPVSSPLLSHIYPRSPAPSLPPSLFSSSRRYSTSSTLDTVASHRTKQRPSARLHTMFPVLRALTPLPAPAWPSGYTRASRACLKTTTARRRSRPPNTLPSPHGLTCRKDPTPCR
jgi:nicotinamide phosphoribosyltransferase